MESTEFSEDLFHEHDLEKVYKPKPNEYNIPQPKKVFKPQVSVVVQESNDAYFWDHTR